MARRFQFSLRTVLFLVFAIAVGVRPASNWLRNYLATRGHVLVTGCVYFKGQPLKDAQVVMTPSGGGKTVQGVTNASGDYEVETLVTPGVYNVSILPVGTASVVPPKYANASTSGLMISVSPDRHNHIAFDVSK